MRSTENASGGAVAGGGVLRAAGLMGVATFLSRILGLVREQAFAILFGAGNATDAFNVAFRIPNLLRDLFAEGAMSASLVPTFTQARIEEGERRAWRVAGLVFRVLFVVVSVIALVGMFFAPELVELYASSYRQTPGKFELTVQMTRMLFPFFPMVALAAAFMGILNACGVFFIPAFSSALFNIVSVVTGVAISLLLMGPASGLGFAPIQGMAIGVLAGGAVQALCQLPSLYRSGYRWIRAEGFDFIWHCDPALRRMLWLMVPGTVGLAATQVNILVNTILATSQGSGAVSWLNYAFRLMQFPIGVFGVSLASATLPAVSAHWVRKDLPAVREGIERSLRYVFAINLPASAGLAFLGYPILELIFQYGHFQPEDTLRTAMALAAYSVGLTAYSMVKVLVPVCYAMGNTRVPVISSILAVGSTIGVNLALVNRLGFWGLALGTSCGAILNAGMLLSAVRQVLIARGESMNRFLLFRVFLSYLGIALLMGLLCFYSIPLFQAWFPDQYFGAPVFGRLFRVALLIAEGGGAVVALAYLFRLRDLTEVLDLFGRKIRNRLKRKASEVKK